MVSWIDDKLSLYLVEIIVIREIYNERFVFELVKRLSNLKKIAVLINWKQEFYETKTVRHSEAGSTSIIFLSFRLFWTSKFRTKANEFSYSL